MAKAWKWKRKAEKPSKKTGELEEKHKTLAAKCMKMKERSTLENNESVKAGKAMWWNLSKENVKERENRENQLK